MPPNSNKLVTRVAAIFATAIWATFPAQAQQTDPVWLDELKAQIYQDQTCDANYFLNVHEYELGVNRVYEAKVQCVDGRQFDATRTGQSAPFIIKACQPVVC